MIRTKLYSLVAFLILSFAGSVAVRAADQPLSKDDVRLLLIGGASAEKMTALIQQRGVDFQMTPDLAKKLHDDGASDEVIEALQRAGQKAALTAGASAGKAEATSGKTAASGQTPPPAAGSK